MNAVKNARKSVAVLAALLMAVTAFAVIVSSEESDAAGISFNGDDIKASGFKDGHDGTLTLTVYNDDGEHITSVTVTVKEGTKTYVEREYAVVAGANTIEVRFGMSQGTHAVDVSVKGGESTWSASTEIVVADNVWSNIVTYLAVVLIAVIVIVIAVVYMRANPRNKPTTTFTQLESEKKAASEPAAPAKTEKKQYKAASEETGKIKYTSSRRK